MCKEKYINLFTDFGFKRAFGTAANKRFMIRFLNALFEEEDKIVDINYRNVEQLSFRPDDRGAVFDLYCTTESGGHIIVEMQRAKQHYFIDRSIFYSSFPMHEMAQKGEWDYNLPKIYTVAVLNFVMPSQADEPDFKHIVRLTDVKTKKTFYDKLTYIYLEMPKFAKTIDQLEDEEDIWLYILKNIHLLDRIPPRLQEKIYKEFFRMAEIEAFTPDEAMAYEESLKRMRDYNNTLKTAKDEGREEGRAEGREEGMAEGITKGETQKAIEIAKKLKSSGINTEDISDFTGLSKEEINEL